MLAAVSLAGPCPRNGTGTESLCGFVPPAFRSVPYEHIQQRRLQTPSRLQDCSVVIQSEMVVKLLVFVQP